MNDVKGGYQIIDLSKDNIYDIAKGYNQKAILIKTNSTYVFGSLTKDSNNYILSYVDTDNNLHQITIEQDNTTTDNIIDLESSGGGAEDVTFGDRVDVKSYNSSSNMYTAPSDGIIQLYATSEGAYIQCSLQYKGNTSSFLRCSYNYNQAASLYVRKGTKMFFSIQSGSVNAYFHPYVAV